MELAIDTSTNYAGIAISHEGETLIELNWYSQRNHTVELAPNIKNIMNQMKTEFKSLNAIFVAIGPGSFNGLRVGVSAAKGFAFALNIPLIGINTFEIEAYPFAFTGLPLCPVHNAGRGEIATALYQQDDEWHCLQKEHITTTDKLCRTIKKRMVFCGEIPQPVIQQLQQIPGNRVIIPDATARMRHASYLATLGWQRFNKGIQDNPASLQPIYLRKPPITQRKTR